MTTQTLVMDEIKRRVEAAGLVLVVDAQWANTGAVSAVNGLDAAGARLRYDFQNAHGYFTFTTADGRYDAVAHWTDPEPKGPVVDRIVAALVGAR